MTPATPLPPPSLEVAARDIAALARWVEDFERVVKDAWTNLASVIDNVERRIEELDARLAALETARRRAS